MNSELIAIEMQRFDIVQNNGYNQVLNTFTEAYLPLLDSLQCQQTASSSKTPVVQATTQLNLQYQNTPVYFATLLTSSTFIFVMPILQIFLFNYFNNLSPVNIIWFLIEFLLAMYSIVLIVGSYQIQLILLYVQYYVTSIAQTLMILNIGLLFFTLFYWVTSIQLGYPRNSISQNSYDLALWELFSVIPSIVFLYFFYLFMGEITTYFKTNNNGDYWTNSALSPSTYYLRATQSYLSVAYTWWMNAIIAVQQAMAYYYYISYQVLFVYLNPFNWITWTFSGISIAYFWFRLQVFGY